MNNVPPSLFTAGLYGLAGILVTKLVDWGIARGGRTDTYTDGLRKDIAALRADVATKDARIDAVEASLDTLRTAYRDREDALYRRIGRAEVRIGSLERYITQHGLEVPPWAKEGQP